MVLLAHIFVQATGVQEATPLHWIISQEEMELLDPVYAQDKNLLKLCVMP